MHVSHVCMHVHVFALLLSSCVLDDCCYCMYCLYCLYYLYWWNALACLYATHHCLYATQALTIHHC